MKRIISIILLFILIFSFSSCSKNMSQDKEIKSVSIGDKTHYPIYLYSYSDAKLLDENTFLPSETDQLFQTLANSGFFLSTNKYNIGESIEVDFSCFYGEDGLKMSSEDRENYAHKKVNVVIKEVEKRKISIKEKEDTFIIAYNEMNSISYNVNCNDSYIYRKYSSLSQSRDRLNELVDTNEIETVKENVVISYDTQS